MGWFESWFLHDIHRIIELFFLICHCEAVMSEAVLERRCAEVENKIDISRKTRRLSPKGFVLVITGCYKTREIPIYSNLSGLLVIKSNVAYKLHSDMCLSMPTQSHSQMYLCFHQPKHSRSETFPSRRWHGTACDFPLQLTNGIQIKSKVCFANTIMYLQNCCTYNEVCCMFYIFKSNTLNIQISIVQFSEKHIELQLIRWKLAILLTCLV